MTFLNRGPLKPPDGSELNGLLYFIVFPTKPPTSGYQCWRLLVRIMSFGGESVRGVIERGNGLS